jgi:hypothetical protein
MTVYKPSSGRPSLSAGDVGQIRQRVGKLSVS